MSIDCDTITSVFDFGILIAESILGKSIEGKDVKLALEARCKSEDNSEKILAQLIFAAYECSCDNYKKTLERMANNRG